MSDPKEAPRQSTGSGTSVGYTVEIRSTLIPRTLGKLIVTAEWSPLSFLASDIGVPNRLWTPLAIERGFLTYEAAMALTAWAAADAGYASGLEFRLIKHELKYEFTDTEVGASPAMSFMKMEEAVEFQPVARGAHAD